MGGQLIVYFLLAVAVIEFLGRKPWINRSISIQKETDNGEFQNLNANFPFWFSKARMKRSLTELHEIADERRAFTQERLHQAIRDKEAEQQLEAQSRMPKRA